MLQVLLLPGILQVLFFLGFTSSSLPWRLQVLFYLKYYKFSSIWDITSFLINWDITSCLITWDITSSLITRDITSFLINCDITNCLISWEITSFFYFRLQVLFYMGNYKFSSTCDITRSLLPGILQESPSTTAA